jgi:hypothetical protein
MTDTTARSFSAAQVPHPLPWKGSIGGSPCLCTKVFILLMHQFKGYTLRANFLLFQWRLILLTSEIWYADMVIHHTWLREISLQCVSCVNWTSTLVVRDFFLICCTWCDTDTALPWTVWMESSLLDATLVWPKENLESSKHATNSLNYMTIVLWKLYIVITESNTTPVWLTEFQWRWLKLYIVITL